MKKNVFLFLLFFNTLSAQSQNPLAIGSFAPDFTLTDINNNTHNLYTYLDSGYTVILDISATWCGPCWTFHQSEVFKKLMTNYGSNGLIDPKKIMFFFIEGDTTATLNQLMGVGSGTQGDWVSGSNYPIINLQNSAFKSLYPYSSYPTFYTICANRKVISNRRSYSMVVDTTEAYWLGLANACPKTSNGINAALLTTWDNKIATCPDVAQTINVPIQNMGSAHLNNALVELKINGMTQASQNWSGSLAPYDTAVVQLFNYIGVSNDTLVQLSVTTIGDQNPLDDTLTYIDNNFRASTNQVTMELRLDIEASNKSWQVTNSNNQVVYSSPVYTTADELQTYFYTFNIPSGECYKLEVKSERGLGLLFHNAPNDSAYIKIYDGTASDLLQTSYKEKYWYRFLQAFSYLAPQNVSDIFNQAKISVAPNPFTSYFRYSIDLTEIADVRLSLFDMHGRAVRQLNLTNNIYYQGRVNVEGLAPGLYNLRLNSGAVSKSYVLLKH